jgi:hypothetical protein
MADVRSSAGSRTAEAEVVLRQYHDARRREDQWRKPQLLLALITPIFAVISIVLDRMGRDGSADIALALVLITATAAALLAIQVWRWHRIAISTLNTFRGKYVTEVSLLLRDPL